MKWKRQWMMTDVIVHCLVATSLLATWDLEFMWEKEWGMAPGFHMRKGNGGRGGDIPGLQRWWWTTVSFVIWMPRFWWQHGTWILYATSIVIVFVSVGFGCGIVVVIIVHHCHHCWVVPLPWQWCLMVVLPCGVIVVVIVVWYGVVVVVLCR